jgi:hypothetical protein
MKTLVCVAVLGLALGACTYKSETTVQKAPPSVGSTTYVTPDANSPTGASATTVYHTN